MGPVENITPYGLGVLPNVDRHGTEIVVIAVAAHFAMPAPGERVRDHTPLDEQDPPHFDDVYWEEAPAVLRYEGQSAYARPGTDVYVNGSAWAPGGSRVQSMTVDVRVGELGRSARVFGDRVWSRSVADVVASRPVPFERVPLRWDRAFGGGDPSDGKAYEGRNPAGVGLYRSPDEAAGAPLPNVEDPAAPITDLWSRPDPVGFGAIGRHWQPRASFAGTYDEDWKRERAPLWPEDFDERFFLAAAPGLSAVPHLRGGEGVYLSGLHPGGAIGFALPTVRIRCKSVFAGRVEQATMRLDAVILEPDEGRFTLVHRWTVPLGRDRAKHRYSVVRVLEDWEPDA